MARLRKGVCYRRIERPYTRVSKYRELSYVKSKPHLKITKFEMGNPNGKFDVQFDLISKSDLQVRQEAIEAARKVIVKILDRKVGNYNYFFRIRKYPHHVLRENPLATGAGADRLSTGMSLAFGKPIGIAAQVFKNEPIFTIKVSKEFRDIVRSALRSAKSKLPNQWSITEKILK